MNIINILFSLIIFFVSSFGYYVYINNKYHIDVFYLPSLVVAIQVTFLFIFGITNLLFPGSIIIYIIGIILFIKEVIIKKTFNKQLLIITTLLFVFIFVLYFLLKDKTFVQYDNFSHWALVVKSMLRSNFIPQLSNAEIEYRTYPLGSSLFIFYFCKMIGSSEPIQMLSQSFMIISCLIPLFKHFKKSYMIILISILSMNILLIYNISLIDLLVDTLLPITAICSFSYIYDNFEKDSNINVLFSVFYLIEIAQIKKPGIFYVLFISAFLIYKAIKKRNWFYFFPTIGAFISTILWAISIKIRFGTSSVGKFSLALDNLLYYYSEKAGQRWSIVYKMVDYVLKSHDTTIFYVFFVLTVLTIIIVSRFDKKYIKVFSGLFIMYIMYLFGLLLMYMFTMPVSEAVVLGGIDRYIKSIIIAELYGLFLCINSVFNIGTFRNRFLYASVSLILIISLYCSIFHNRFIILIDEEYSKIREEKDWLESVKKQYCLPADDCYIISIPQQDYGYSDNLGMYVLDSKKCYSQVIDDINKIIEVNANYLLLYDRNDIINNWINENYPEQYNNDVIVLK